MATDGSALFILIALAAGIILIFPREILYGLGFVLLFSLLLGMSTLISVVPAMRS